MSDVYAELRQAIVALKRKYPDLFYRPGDVVRRDEDDCLVPYTSLGQHIVGVIGEHGRFWRHGLHPVYIAGDGLTIDAPAVPIGYVTAVDNITKMVDVLFEVAP